MKKKEALIKLVEECAELLHAVSKKQRYPNTYIHDGRILDEQISKEMADVIAAIYVNKHLLNLNPQKIDKRIDEKLEKWGNPNNVIRLKRERTHGNWKLVS